MNGKAERLIRQYYSAMEFSNALSGFVISLQYLSGIYELDERAWKWDSVKAGLA